MATGLVSSLFSSVNTGGGGGGGGGSNLGYNPAANNGVITNDAGTGATIPGATTTNAGLLVASDKTRLNTIDFIILQDIGLTATKAQRNIYFKNITTADVICTLPSYANPDSATLNIINSVASTKTVTITLSGANTFTPSGATNLVLGSGEEITLIFDGSNFALSS